MSTDAAPRPELPDHLSVDARSTFYQPEVLSHAIGVRFNGQERHDVQEYCQSESWIKVPAGKTLDRKGQPLLLKLKGRVEVYYIEVA
jgi:predicted house-cleaning NTP pyrophosphatase (Maf/HAM1 superfamily)